MSKTRRQWAEETENEWGGGGKGTGVRARDVRREKGSERGRVTHQKRNVLSLPKEPQTPLQWSLPLNTLNHPLPRPRRLFLSHNGRLFLPPSLSPPTDGSYRCCFPTLAEHSSLTGHWFWTGMTQLADHGRWTSTAPPAFGANTYTAKTASPLVLPSQCKATRQIPALVWFIEVTLFNYTKP